MGFGERAQGGEEVTARAKLEAAGLGLSRRKDTGARAEHFQLKRWRKDISGPSSEKNTGSAWVPMEAFSYVR